MKKVFSTIQMIIGAIVLLIIIIWYLTKDVRLENEFKNNGVTTTGEIIYLDATDEYDDMGNQTFQFLVTYEYYVQKDSESQRFEKTIDVDFDTFKELKEDMPVNVIYLPYDPGRSELILK